MTRVAQKPLPSSTPTAPAEVARRVESAGGVTKAALGDRPNPGARRARPGRSSPLGRLFFLVAITESGLGFGVERLSRRRPLSPSGLISGRRRRGRTLHRQQSHVVIAWADRKISVAPISCATGAWSYVANFAGGAPDRQRWSCCVRRARMRPGGAVGETATRVAAPRKPRLSFCRGVLPRRPVQRAGVSAPPYGSPWPRMRCRARSWRSFFP